LSLLVAFQGINQILDGDASFVKARKRAVAEFTGTQCSRAARIL